MRKNLASVIILGATAALSLSTVSPALAAAYPSTVTNVSVNTSTLVVGTPVGTIEKFSEVPTAKSTPQTIALNKPLDLTVSGLKPGTKATASIKAPDGSTIKLPALVVNSKGIIDTKAMVFKKPGKYVLTYKLPNGVTKTVTITVKG